jgi:hypothetical protein
VALECRLRDSLQVGEGTMLFGDVVHLHVDRSVWRNGRIDTALLRPVGRLSGMTYCTVDDIYRLELPEDVRAAVDDYEIRGGEPELQKEDAP